MIVVDPGVTTGVAIFDGDTLVRTFTCQTPFDDLRRAFDELDTEFAVIEHAPANAKHYMGTHNDVAAIVREHARAIYWVWPASWKQHPAGDLAPEDQRRGVMMTKHEHDATSIGRYVLAVKPFALADLASP